MNVAAIIVSLFITLSIICAVAFARASAIEEDAADDEIDFTNDWKWPHL